MIDHYLCQDNLEMANTMFNSMLNPNSVTFSCFAKYFLNKKEL